MTRMQRRYELACLTNSELQIFLHDVSDLTVTVVIKAGNHLEISRSDAINTILNIEDGQRPFDPDEES